MFTDYVPLLLINMTAGYALLAWFVYKDFAGDDHQRWAPAFGIVGLVAFAAGMHMAWTWPLPGPYNAAFGDLSVLYGALFLGASLAFAKRWDPFGLTVYAFFAGLTAVVLGVRFISLGLTQAPLFSGIGFILSGGAGVCALPAYYLRASRLVRILAVLVLAGAALIWALTACMAFWGHMASFGKYVPPSMRTGASF